MKDMFAARTEAPGTSSYAGDLAGRLILVKDGAGRLGTQPRFGDGWGWAFYEGAEMKRTVTTNYKNLPCHEPAHPATCPISRRITPCVLDSRTFSVSRSRRLYLTQTETINTDLLAFGTSCRT